jgi:hypothetical protein
MTANEPLRPDLRVPDVVGEIIGWRAWQVVGGPHEFPLLKSVTHKSTLWHPNHWTLATCQGEPVCKKGTLVRPRNDGRIPGEGCRCGLYAARDRAHLIQMGYHRAGGQIVFIGEVGLTGKVIPGDQGWRAEKGRIVRLYVPFEHWAYVDRLEQVYEVPVLLDNTNSPKGVS